MLNFMTNKTDAVQFVEDILRSSDIAFQWITITNRGTSEDCCVSIAIDISSVDIVEKLGQIYLKELMSIS